MAVRRHIVRHPRIAVEAEGVRHHVVAGEATVIGTTIDIATDLEAIREVAVRRGDEERQILQAGVARRLGEETEITVLHEGGEVQATRATLVRAGVAADTETDEMVGGCAS